MSRLTCGPRSRSNSFSPSPSRSPSLKSYLSASASPRSGPSPTISSKIIKPKDISPRKRPKKLVRSLTLPSADNSLPVKVLFPNSSESEDKFPNAKVPGISPKLKNQMLVDFQTKPPSMNGVSFRTHPPSAIHGRTVSSAHRPDSLRAISKRINQESGLKGVKPKAQFTLQVIFTSFWFPRLVSLYSFLPGH